MKIARFIARLNVGGPAIHVTLVTDELRKRGHDCLLAAGNVPSGEGDMGYYAAEHGVTVVTIPELVRPVSPKNDLLALWKIYRLLRREKPDVVHTHTAKAGTLGRLAAILAGTPVVVHTFHGNIFDSYFSPAATRIFLAIERFLAHFTDRIVTVSASQRLELAYKYRIAPLEKIQVIPLGLDLGPFLELPALNQRRESDAPGDLADVDQRPFIIGWVGRFVDVKDPLLFLDFARELSTDSPRVKFLMVGDGPMRAEIEKKIDEYSLRERITIAGWRRDMARVYQEIDLLVLTSRNEGTPVAILEAMASGRPFVSTKVGGVADLTCGLPALNEGFDVYANGILAHQRNANLLAQAASLLVDDSSRRATMGAAGRSFVRASFNKVRLAQDLESVYREFLESRDTSKSEVISRSEEPGETRSSLQTKVFP
jgi:glycosyltransferase involved in cell wall biosynthesis